MVQSHPWDYGKEMVEGGKGRSHSYGEGLAIAHSVLPIVFKCVMGL